MFVSSVAATVLAVSTFALATGYPRYTQFAFKFQSNANCRACSVENTTVSCFHGILDCVQMSFNTHNATLVVKPIANATEKWILLVLQLQPSTKIDSSHFVEGCVNNMTHWEFWNYAECTMDIFGVGDYQNCSETSQPATGNPVFHYSAWVYVGLAFLASMVAVLSIILCIICYKKWGRGFKTFNCLKALCRNEEGQRFNGSDPDDDRQPLNNLSVQAEPPSDPLSSESPPVAYEPKDYGTVGPAYSRPTARPTAETAPVIAVAAEGATSKRKSPKKCPKCGYKFE